MRLLDINVAACVNQNLALDESERLVTLDAQQRDHVQSARVLAYNVQEVIVEQHVFQYGKARLECSILSWANV